MEEKSKRALAGYIGRTGSGKTTLLKLHTACVGRVVIWDWKGEYAGPVAQTYRELAVALRARRFHIRFRPLPWCDLADTFSGLAGLVYDLGEDLTVCCDEVALVCPNMAEGGIGHLLRYARDKNISLRWATQRPTGIPGILFSETREFYLFHCDHPIDLQVLSKYMDPRTCARIRSLAEYQYVTLNK